MQPPELRVDMMKITQNQKKRMLKKKQKNFLEMTNQNHT
jgi:hypothetical protein